MDRREFLKSTSVAAVAGSAAGATGTATAQSATASTAELAAPAVILARREISLAVPLSLDTLEIGAGAFRLARRIETAFDNRISINISRTDMNGFDAITSGQADLYLGLDADQAATHPGFAVLAGMPARESLNAVEQQAWQTIGSGAELRGELAQRLGIHSLIAGHTGASPGLYAERILETADDLRGLRIACRGLARDVVAELGATPVALDEGDLRGAITAQRLDAAEPLQVPTAAVAHWSYQPGLTPGGYLLSLGLGLTFWHGLTRAEQAILEGLAAEAHAYSQAENIGRAATMRQVARFRRWPVATSTPGDLQAALDAAATRVIDRIGDHDNLARRIVDSARAFRGHEPAPGTSMA
jgi:TRAP-type mannitol/chloroaromatic compound transport system substrate-binding protein